MRLERFLFFAILALGTFLRLYRLPETMQFFGDQGRDALIARSILIDHDPAFIGPVTSVGNMYLGPFYYYFMVIPLYFSYPSPVGPAYAVAIVGCMTLALVYILGKEMVGKHAAFFAYFLYAISPIIVEYVRFSWNPNIVPLFSLLLLWSVFQTFQKKYWHWSWIGVYAAILFQLHYITLILIGAVGCIWLYQCLKIVWNREEKKKDFFIPTALAIGIFLLSLLPILLFDTRHDWLNTKAFLSFFLPKPGGEKHFYSFSDFSGIFVSYISLTGRLLIQSFTKSSLEIGQKILVFGLFCYFMARSFFMEKEKTEQRHAQLLLVFFFFLSVGVLSLYRSSVFDHYLGFLFPSSMLLLGVMTNNLWKNVFYRPLVVVLLVFFCIFSYKEYPGFFQLSGTVRELKEVAQTIKNNTDDGVVYNMLAYSPSKDLQALNIRYFLTTMGVKLAAQDDVDNFSQLIVIDEEKKNTPFDETQYIIVLWPNRKIFKEFLTPNGTKVYILRKDL